MIKKEEYVFEKKDSRISVILVKENYVYTFNEDLPVIVNAGSVGKPIDGD